MNVNLDIIPVLAPPYLFNPVKHHLNLIKKFIRWGCRNRNKREFILEQINSIGDPITDIYRGEFSVYELKELLELRLIEIDAYCKEKYIDWLNKNGHDYNSIKLNDMSIWTFRYGEKRDRYIHFHPGRYSKWSIRVRGTTLRTVIAVKIFAPKPKSDIYQLDIINSIRQDILDMSPVKSVVPNKGIGLLLSMI
jgi:hypothetical protein